MTTLQRVFCRNVLDNQGMPEGQEAVCSLLALIALELERIADAYEEAHK